MIYVSPVKKLRAKAAHAQLAPLACIALSACAATPAQLTAHTTETQYVAGAAVVVVVENSGGRRAEIIGACCSQLERFEKDGWRDVGCDGMACEESLRYVEAHGDTEYWFRLARSLATGRYRLEVQNAFQRTITMTNAFNVEECVRAVPEGDAAATAARRPSNATETW